MSPGGAYGIVTVMSTMSPQRTLSDFDYFLPEELIAQVPVPERDRSRLLVLERPRGSITHHIFGNIGAFLRRGDLLVLNDTRVVPCRIPARKPGGGKAELFLLEEEGVNLWRALVRGSIGTGGTLSLAESISADILAVDGDGVRTIRFHGIPDIRCVLEEIGKVPLPPYIRREPSAEDVSRYQTIYAACDGAVAAPTAGLHFTGRLLRALEEKGVGTAMVTLHVGPGTFQPVRSEDLSSHRMHAERYSVPEGTAERIARTRREGGRVVAVGTTAVRTIETAADEHGAVRPGDGVTDLFILPGYRFRAVDGMITNFHLPKSTLLMLVSAFAGREYARDAYASAVRERYRFYSYGDAMLIL